MRQRILESVLTAILLGLLSTAWGTYNEVRELRHDVNSLSKELAEMRGDLDGLYAEVSEQVQRLDKNDKPVRR